MRIELQRLKSDDELLTRLQDNIQTALSELGNIPLMGGRLVLDVALTTGGDNVVNHGLDRPLTGWIAVRNSAQSTLWDTQGANPTPSRTLTLRTSATCTVNLWVF